MAPKNGLRAEPRAASNPRAKAGQRVAGGRVGVAKAAGTRSLAAAAPRNTFECLAPTNAPSAADVAPDAPLEVLSSLSVHDAEESIAAQAPPTQESQVQLPSGDVVVRYSHYNESFAMEHGRLTADAVDELYCLGHVMPGCRIHLSSKSPEEKYAMESAGDNFPFMFEDPPGVFHGLELGQEYYVYVTEDEEEFRKSQARARIAFADVSAKSGEHADHSELYTSAFKQVMLDAKLEGQRQGFDGEALSAFVQTRLAEFNA